MLGMEIPVRTPTSFLFFAASGFAAYFSGEIPALRWWAYSAFTLFIALGPARWTEQCINAFQIRRWIAGVGDRWIPIQDTEALAVTIRWLAGLLQVLLFGVGSYLGFHGLLELRQHGFPPLQP